MEFFIILIIPPGAMALKTTGNVLHTEIYGLIIYISSLPLEPHDCGLEEKEEKKKWKIQWQVVGWNSGSDTANCVFLLTFNSPKHPCFTASWAIAFLNLSLERQELWSLSIEEKGMLFPCHLLVAPPSSLPWSTVQHPSIPFLFPTLLCRKLEAKSLPLAVEMRAMEKCSGGEGGGGGPAYIGLEVPRAAARWY